VVFVGRLTNEDTDVRDAESFLRQAAKKEGLTWHQYCAKYGIIDDSDERQIRRHEVPLKQ